MSNAYALEPLMQFEYPLLEALAAVVREGTFEAAARSLNISQSAVSQRVKLLEERTGAVLVVRGRPCIATEYGQQLCRHVDQVQLLEQDLHRNLSSLDENASSEAPAAIRVAVNRDSLATWFPEVIECAGSKLNLHFDVIPDDQEHTAERLRSGEALAAITAEANPLQGCRRFPLGAIEYIAVANEGFKTVSLRDLSFDDFANATCIVFDRKDTLPQQWMMNAFGKPAPLRGHWLPSFSGYLVCCLNGVGWGMMPRFSVKRHLQEGSLVELLPGRSIIVPLYWQSTTPNSQIMRALSSIVATVAQKHLLSTLTAPVGGFGQ